MLYSRFDRKVRRLLGEEGGILISGIVKEIENKSWTPRKITILKSFTIDGSHGKIFIVPNRLVTMNLKKGVEVWAVGGWLSEDRFKAQALFFPEHQQQVDVFRMDYIFALLPIVPLTLMIIGVFTPDFLMVQNAFAVVLLLLLIST